MPKFPPTKKIKKQDAMLELLPPLRPIMKRGDFREEVSWRIFRIMAEFIDGFQFLADLKKEVSIFGSTRFTEKNPHYQDALELSRRLGKAGYTIVTGGGPGIMEAANRGATETGAVSIGLNIQLPKEQRVNKYVKHGIGFHYFFTRKTMLSASAQAYIFFPGGFGTLDEMFEILTLIQTKKMEPIPLILFGRDFWAPLLKWIERECFEVHHAVSKEDMKIYTLVDTVDAAFNIIAKSKERQYF